MLWRKKGKSWIRAYILTGEHRITQLVPIRHSRDFLDKDDWIMIIGVHAKLSIATPSREYQRVRRVGRYNPTVI
jgi:hypothetical protein